MGKRTLTAVETAARDALEARVSETGKVLRAFPKGPMGLTLDSVKATPEWRAAKSAADTAFRALRAFNASLTA